MNLLGNPRDPRYALRFAQYLTALSQANPGPTIDEMIAADTSSIGRYFCFNATDNMPTWFVGEYLDFTIILIAGCSNFNQADRTINAYRGGLLPEIARPVNGYFVAAKDWAIGRMAEHGFPTKDSKVIAGHSLGGAIAEHLTAQYRQGAAPDGVRLITFGAPAPGNRQFASDADVQYRARWMTSDDPVPLAPHAWGALPNLLLSYSASNIHRFANFVHTGGGLQIDASAIITPAILPRDAVMSPVSSLSSWLLAIDGSSASGHHIATYRARLSEWVLGHPQPDPPLPRVAPIQDPIRVSRGEVNNQQAAAVQQLTVIAERNNAVPLQVPANRLFRAVRNGRIWLVTTNDHPIAVTPHRRAAQHLARSLNDAFGRLQVQPLVNSDEFAAQVQDYLAAATAAGGNFSPPMNDGLPNP